MYAILPRTNGIAIPIAILASYGLFFKRSSDDGGHSVRPSLANFDPF